ncbi:MAG TPA: phosphatidylinositol mannoside acyltransferase [Acidimicrobiales bacterium]|nr:phosphatidylinositol mannoside acyltransferase [Acidimicrobiales bacterium]
MSRLREWRRLAPFYGYRAVDALARVVPAALADRLGAALMRALSNRMGSRSHVVREHMRRVLGPAAGEHTVEEAARECFAVYGRYWAEAFRIASMSRAQLDAGMEWEGLVHVEHALQRGTGAILAMPHIGGFDWGGAWFAASGYDTTVVAETLEPPELFDFFKTLREGFGLEVVGIGDQASRAILRRLRSNGLVGLVCDRDIAGTGAEVDFFGSPTTIPAGPATLALRTGAAVLPCAVFFGSHGLRRGVVRPPLDMARTGAVRDDVQRITQALAREFESLIRLAPEQWHILQPNWPDIQS